MTEMLIAGLFVVVNVAVLATMTELEMYCDFWRDQKLIGKITASIVFAPAWLIKKVFNFCRGK